ncbi:exosome complex component RRP46 [Euwallacea fornicatus]|uniref:exosome complex component RRP46 n=1 Tax=Euwallacea fornicatus TaxID=995702 RepID=UPI00338F1350
MEVDLPNIPSLKCKLGLLSRSDGSAFFVEGESAVIASVHGPVEVKMKKMLIDKASIECCYRPKAESGVQDRYRESVIKNICETAIAAVLYPRAAVILNIQEMQDRGQLVSCAINATCMACLDSGIAMKFIFGAVSVYLNKAEEFTFSPPISENDLKATFVFVFNNTSGKIVASHTEGSFTAEQFKEALSLCKKQSIGVFQFIKMSLLAIDK